jgi:hypothetical protein
MTAKTFVARHAIFASLFCLAGCASSGLLHTNLSASECVSQAKQVLYDADFTENPVVSRETASVSGRHGGYKATIHCESGTQIIHVDVDGLDPTQVDQYRDFIIRKF